MVTTMDILVNTRWRPLFSRGYQQRDSPLNVTKTIQPRLSATLMFRSTYGTLLPVLLPAFGDSFSLRTLKPRFTIFHVIVPLFSTFPNGFCFIPRLQELPYNTLHLVSIPILTSLVHYPSSFFPSVVLARFLKFSSTTHVSLAPSIADYLRRTLYKLA